MGKLGFEHVTLDPEAFENDWHGAEPADSMCRKYGLRLHELYRIRRRLGLDARDPVPFEDPASIEDLRRTG